jgi:opacity protein-like surface antigen
MKKKILVLCLALAMLGGFAWAQEDEGIGLELGFEGGLDHTDSAGSFKPFVAFGRSFGPVDFGINLEYTIGADAGAPQSLFFEEDIGYNLELNDSSSLIFNLHNENDFMLFGDFDEENGDSILEPSVAYALGISAGDLAFTLGVPITYIYEGGGGDTPGLGINLTVGHTFTNGFGVALTGNIDILQDAAYADTDLVLSYVNDHFYVELEIDAEDDTFKSWAFYPYMEFYLGKFTAYVGIDFEGIGPGDPTGAGGQVSTVAPYIGGKFSF